ncbi:Hsp20/alpha crystallin family protein [Actinoplanes sp. NPDC049316]|uniref:Hsp20/alpha crystallin family protein n=1 Tax=Actinoplanes sp. NPDC049316 TaxID=3154727 RepID=UPI0034127736
MTITTPVRYRRLFTVPARRGDPRADLEHLPERIGEIINSFLRGERSFGGASRAPFWVPAADLEETDDTYVLELEAPGVHRDDLIIEVRDNEVRVAGEIKQEERMGMLRQAGRFQYVVALPEDIDQEQVEAFLHDGVLAVRLRKAAAGAVRPQLRDRWSESKEEGCTDP